MGGRGLTDETQHNFLSDQMVVVPSLPIYRNQFHSPFFTAHIGPITFDTHVGLRTVEFDIASGLKPSRTCSRKACRLLHLIVLVR